eukprot:CAMPEP_0184648042 /NCGR_PEP_ID=MMETSP0308-20130426/5100_1 /TAXON_ID=38269 /ORGANISM="Gloeochaete witrockiana, Strain SAG 46.84" /LENGTH=336 /DNA_ID=CAMNT_0027079549 /DNA_START=217 /DNA_END=1227 /DNA_ORIENTATION=+
MDGVSPPVNNEPSPSPTNSKKSRHQRSASHDTGSNDSHELFKRWHASSNAPSRPERIVEGVPFEGGEVLPPQLTKLTPAERACNCPQGSCTCRGTFDPSRRVSDPTSERVSHRRFTVTGETLKADLKPFLKNLVNFGEGLKKSVESPRGRRDSIFHREPKTPEGLEPVLFPVPVDRSNLDTPDEPREPPPCKEEEVAVNPECEDTRGRGVLLKAGILSKQGRVMKSWKQRWFEIYSAGLTYSEAPGSEARQIVPLAEISAPVVLCSEKFEFFIQVQGSKMVLRAESLFSMNEWVEAFEEALNGETPGDQLAETVTDNGPSHHYVRPNVSIDPITVS